jgi:DNA-binding transcriptional LysR family regulator
MNTHELKIFTAVAENLSFTRAADQLMLTQSAVSHQIAKLERSLGAILLKREGRNVALTPVGQELLRQSRKIFASIDDATAAVRQAARPDVGRLRIGASSTACQYIIPEALREFRECFPAYSLAITPGDSPQITANLLDGEIDLGILIRDQRQRKLSYHELFSDELQFMVSPLHPWAKARKVDRRELSSQHLVLYGRGSVTYQMVERYFAKMKIAMGPLTELSDFGAIKELVKLGLGVSVTAPWTARPEEAEGSLVLLPMPGKPLTRAWCVANLASRELSVAEQTFFGLCQAVAKQFSV